MEENTVAQSEDIKEAKLTEGSFICEKYQVEKILGSGGMGTVYQVKQVFLGKTYALKIVNSKQVSEMNLRRFQQEARMAASLKHPNLVEVHDFGVTEDQHPHLVMDFIKGESLAQVLKKVGTLNYERVIALTIQVAFGLLYAHENKVVHRDIKPGNIMLLHADEITSEGTVKIVDFGIAKLLQSDEGEMQALTKTGEVFGSPLYMSPEQCKGTAVDARSDIYSLGCVMFECLTGSPPFFGDTAMSTMLKRLSEPAPSLKEGSLGRDFPAALEKICQKCLAVEPADRYQSMAELVQDLTGFQRKANVPEAAIIATEKRSAKRQNSQSFLVIACLIAGVVSALATLAVDRLYLFQTDASREDRSTSKSKGITDLTELNESTRKEFRKVLGDQNATEFPSVETRTDLQDRKWRLIHFPTDCGQICEYPEKSWRKAFGTVKIPFDKEIELRLNPPASQEPRVLRDITDLKFHLIEFSRTFAVFEDGIAVLGQIPYLKEVDLAGANVTSLKPLYNNQLLQALLISASKVPSKELLKIKRLGDLDQLSFGPVGDPKIVFDALLPTKKIRNLVFRGYQSQKKTPDSHLSTQAVESLSRLTSLDSLTITDCLNFDNAKLQKLTSLKNLTELVIRDCDLTPDCLAILKRFPRLEQVHLTSEGWTEQQKASFAKQRFEVEFDRSKSKENQQKKLYMEGALDLIP